MTPLRPLADDGACTTCQPSGAAAPAGSSFSSARTSWQATTSAFVDESHSTKPFFAAARRPLTFTVETVSTRRTLPGRSDKTARGRAAARKSGAVTAPALPDCAHERADRAGQLRRLAGARP